MYRSDINCISRSNLVLFTRAFVCQTLAFPSVAQLTAAGDHGTAIGVVNGNVTVNNVNDATLMHIADQLNAIKVKADLSNKELQQIVGSIDVVYSQLASIKDDTAQMKLQLKLLTDTLTKAANSPATARDTLAPLLVPPSLQYLYASGEAAGVSRQAYNGLVDAIRQRLQDAAAASTKQIQIETAALTIESTLDNPVMVPCTNKPPAVIFDVDETLLLNFGYEYYSNLHPGGAYDPTLWDDWERNGIGLVLPVPGAPEAIAELRKLGITPIYISNRSARNAAATEAALNRIGLGPAKHGQTLFVLGDEGASYGKDQRRVAVAARFCVVAMVGDQLSDFSDLFSAEKRPSERRRLANLPAISALWGRRWFILPNPVYGAGLRGDFDEVFPVDMRWRRSGN